MPFEGASVQNCLIKLAWDFRFIQFTEAKIFEAGVIPSKRAVNDYLEVWKKENCFSQRLEGIETVDEPIGFKDLFCT